MEYSMSEYQILNTMHGMLTVVKIYKTKNNATKNWAVHLLIIRFTGQLKGWWDNYLFEHNIVYILKAVKAEDGGNLVLDTNGQPIQDSINTLIYTIIKHFVGDPLAITARASEILSNLRCPKLEYFRWYKRCIFQQGLS